MKSRLPLFSTLLFIFCLEIIIASPVDAVIKILPLGNSITQGISSGEPDPAYQVSYRKRLWDLLVAEGYDVDFVGTLNSGSAVFVDPDLADHEGHPGWTADEIVNGASYDPGAGKLEDWLITEQPDIVLLHIGTNDLYWDPQDPADVAIEVSQILDVIDAYSVDIPVILALIVNHEDYICETPSTTTTFNNLVENMALDRINDPINPAYPDKIEIVDMECGADIDYRNQSVGGDMANILHPFETGYEKMADVWFSSIFAITHPVADAGPDQSVVEGDTVMLDASNSVDPDGMIDSYFWEQMPGGPPVVLSDPEVVNPTFTAPDVGLGVETLTFQVTVTDDVGLESTDTINVDVSSNVGDDLTVDFDGDATTDIAIYRPSIGIWYIVKSSGGNAFAAWGGLPNDIPVPGNYDGDGNTDVAIYRTNGWYIKPSSGGSPYVVGFGQANDVPVPGDYDGDGNTDVAVYRLSNGLWYIKPSSGGSPYAVGLGGVPNDIPVNPTAVIFLTYM